MSKHQKKPETPVYTLDEWHEDVGDVLWWKFPIEEPPYVGTPNDGGRPVQLRVAGQSVRLNGLIGGWPGYHTHWTPLPPPPVEPKP